MISIYWPIISNQAGFSKPDDLPTFLTLETAQYCMGKILNPLLLKGYFQQVTIEKNRLYSQILDNLNKSAIAGFSLTEIAERLGLTTINSADGSNTFMQVQECALLFRKYCMDHNLLDFSLQLEIFINYVWPLEICQENFYKSYACLIADNIEEDTSFSHTILSAWMKKISCATIILNRNGGFRTFMGADQTYALTLIDECKQVIQFSKEFIPQMELLRFRDQINSCITKSYKKSDIFSMPKNSEIHIHRFFPDMIDDVFNRIENLLEDGVAPDQIAILAPFISDSLNFLFRYHFFQKSVPFSSPRPSRKYLDDPNIKSILALSKIAHPQWELPPSRLDIIHVLLETIPEINIIQADLIAQTLFSINPAQNQYLRSFDEITNPTLQNRISYAIGEKYEIIRKWIQEYVRINPDSLDIFIQRLYGELLSQDGFLFHKNNDAAKTIAKLIFSIKEFRNFSSTVFSSDFSSIGKEYIEVIETGLIPAAFEHKQAETAGILLSPAHSFLMKNQPVDYQFWLDIGNLGWWERINQPLTNPYLLRKSRQPNKSWTEKDEYTTNQNQMAKLVHGLISYCKKAVFISSVEINEYGSEQRSPLLRAFQTFQKQALKKVGKK